MALAPWSKLLWAFLTSFTLAAETTTLTTIENAHQRFQKETFRHQYATHQYAHQSHAFSSKPRALINSVLLKVKQGLQATNAEESHHSTDESSGVLLDVDVSSSCLKDAALTCLLDGLVSMLWRAKAKDAHSRSFAAALSMRMNQLTPSGAAKVFDILLREGGVDDDGNSASVGTDSKDLSNRTKIYNVSEDESTLLEQLDLSFNDIGGHGIHALNVQLVISIRKLFRGGTSCFIPRILSMENCGIGPAFCRAIARGILDSFQDRNTTSAARNWKSGPSILRLAGNSAIGNAGTVALAAAFRMSSNPSHSVDHDDNEHDASCYLIEELDLSSCSVGDAGAEALALALASNPRCLLRLDLSNNMLTDSGAEALGRALIEAHRTGSIFKRNSPFMLEEIVLDNNEGLGDRGAAALAEAFACGAVGSVSLRSCSIGADGVAEFGKAMANLVKRSQERKLGDGLTQFNLDLSGNRFGTLKIKKKKGAAYSARLIRDKASSRINFIGKRIRSGLKGAGITVGSSLESDDESDLLANGLLDSELDDGIIPPATTAASCGARSFTSEILENDDKEEWKRLVLDETVFNDCETPSLKFTVGMRECFLDEGAFDALSASIVFTNGLEADVTIDVSLNDGAEDSVIDALQKKGEKKLLIDMAHRHCEALDIIRQARQRALLAAQASTTRIRAETGRNDPFYFDETDSPAESEYDPYGYDLDV